MKSIFDLKTKNSELSSANQGLTNYKFDEIQPLRNVTEDSFPDGEQIFRWTFGSNKYWVPSKSYVKMKIKLTDPSGNPLERSENIAWAMNTIPTLFQASSYKIADQTVCNITQNLAQVDTLLNRQTRSQSWLSGVGNDLNNWEHSFRKRQDNMYSLGGLDVSGLNQSYDWESIKTDCTIVVADSITITKLANGSYQLTFTDAAGADLDLLAANSQLRVGDLLVYELKQTDPDRTETSSGVITDISQLSITFVPNEGALTTGSPAATLLISDALFSMYTVRHDYYDEKATNRQLDAEFIWYPTLSVFRSVKHAIPCGSTKHEFTLTPYSDSTYQKNAIQSLISNKTNGTDFLLTVTEMKLYILTCDSNKIEDNFEFMLDLDEIQCQSTPITSTQQQQTLDVIPSTHALALAFIDKDALNDTRYPLTRFTIRDDLELNLTRYYIRYEGQRPSPDAVTELDVTLGKDYLKDVYNRTKLYDGTLYMENPEDLATFRSRGMYLFHPFPKTSSSRNTRVYVQVNFSSLTDSDAVEQNPFLLLFSYYKKAVVLTVQNGRIINVAPYNA